VLQQQNIRLVFNSKFITTSSHISSSHGSVLKPVNCQSDNQSSIATGIYLSHWWQQQGHPANIL